MYFPLSCPFTESHRQLKQEQPVYIPLPQLVETVFSHPQLWPGHHPHSGLIIVLLIKSVLWGLSFKGLLQPSKPLFLTTLHSPSQKTLRTLLWFPAHLPYILFLNFQHWLRPLATDFSPAVGSTELVRLSTHLLLSARVSSTRDSKTERDLHSKFHVCLTFCFIS